MATSTAMSLGSAPPRRRKLVEDSVLGMALFLMAEGMLFSGLISAFAIVKTSVTAEMWPPPGQPRLPVEATAVNTAVLLASGVALFLAWRSLKAGNRDQLKKRLSLATLLGGFFVVFQGLEWVRLIGRGLTLTSSQLGSFFYLIVGCHALHAIGALIGLLYVRRQLVRGAVRESTFLSAALFWYFVVGVWPVLYWLVYL